MSDDPGLSCIEVRTYAIRSGREREFERLVREHALPMLGRWKVDVVHFGRSVDDSTYTLIRAYDDVAHRDASQDAFYGSAEWREGPREPILDCIEHHLSVLLYLDRSAFRRGETMVAGQAVADGSV